MPHPPRRFIFLGAIEQSAKYYTNNSNHNINCYYSTHCDTAQIWSW